MWSLLCLPFTFTTSNSTVLTVPYSTLYKLVQSWIVRYTHTIRYTVRYTMRYGVPYTKVWTTLYRVGIPKILDQMTLDQITSDQFTGTPLRGSVRYRTMTCRTCTVRAAVRYRTSRRTAPYDVSYGGSYGAVRRLVRSYCDDLDLYRLFLNGTKS